MRLGGLWGCAAACPHTDGSGCTPACRYSVPKSAAAQLEEAFRDKLPDQFGSQPDLLFDPVSWWRSENYSGEPFLALESASSRNTVMVGVQ